MERFNLIVSGTPNTILNEITKYLKITVTYYTIYFPDLPDRRSLKLFAEDVILNIRRRRRCHLWSILPSSSPSVLIKSVY
jgi:hypothetical protein